MPDSEAQYTPRRGRLLRTRMATNVRDFVETIEKNTEFTARTFLDWMCEAYGYAELPNTRQIGYIMRIIPEVEVSEAYHRHSATVWVKI